MSLIYTNNWKKRLENLSVLFSDITNMLMLGSNLKLIIARMKNIPGY